MLTPSPVGRRGLLADNPSNLGLQVALDGLAQRQRAIANNVANAETPNFKASEVRFEDYLTAALTQHGAGLPLQRTAAGHLSTQPSNLADVRPTESIVQTTSYRNDGNNVDIDAQMSLLADTQLRYSALSQVLSSRLGDLRTVINEGRR